MNKKLKMEDMTLQSEEQKYANLTNIDNRETNDEISLIAITELFNKKNKKTMSRVKFDQVAIITKLYLFSSMFGEDFSRKLADLMLEIQVSTNGLGRKEAVQMIQQRSPFGMEEQQKHTSKDIFR